MGGLGQRYAGRTARRHWYNRAHTHLSTTEPTSNVTRRVVDSMGVKEQYRDYVMTGFVKRIEPVVVDHGDGARL